MRLKQIKLAGFKSFVDPTTVPFPDQMTAIVGPNGCGKSNVIDAVRWVLGESSAKNLRGDAMTDVIFNGSTNRKPVSQASVELVFDNSEGRLQGGFADRTEISVKRQVTKEAQSTYFLNGSKCRRKDITDIFLGTGLGPRSYAIIEQGMISRLIESKPQELRVFIEEAAGISKYKERRRETENRIRHTRDNLERLEDVREELGAQLEKLKRQSATAKRFKELKVKERLFKAELYALKWYKYNEQLNVFEKDKLEHEAKLEAFIAEQRGGELGLLNLKQDLQQTQDNAQAKQQELYQVGTHISRLEQQIIFQQQKQQDNLEQQQQLNATLAESEEHLTFEQDRLEELLEQLDELEPQHEMVEEQLLVANELLTDSEYAYEDWQQQWQKKQKGIQQFQQSVQITQTKIQSLETQLVRAKQKINDLQQEKSELTNLDHQQELLEQTKLLEQAVELLQQYQEKLVLDQEAQSLAIEQHQQQNQRLTELNNQKLQVNTQLNQLQQWQKNWQQSQHAGHSDIKTKGSLLANIKVETEWQYAIECLLSYFGSPQLVEQLPAGGLTSNLQIVSADSQNVLQNSAAAVIAQGHFPSWFNQVVLVESYDDGLQKIQQSTFNSALTKDGLWFGENWQTFGGIADADNSNVLQRFEQIDQLQIEIEQNQIAVAEQEVKLADYQEQLKQAQITVNVSQQNVEQAKKQQAERELQVKLLTQQQNQTRSLIDKLDSELTLLTEQVELEQQQVFALEEELQLYLEQQTEQEMQLDGFELQKEQLQQNVSQAKQQVEQHKNQSHQLALQHQTVNSQQDNLKQNIQRATQHQKQISDKLAQINEQLSHQDDPTDLLQQEMEELLISRVELEEQQAESQNSVSELQQKINDLEQGQSGILATMDKMRGDIEAINLDSEGARIRAQNMLDTLDQMQQPLKPVLENMSPDANEEEWSETLEKTTHAISRLGAINLAAIEEYDIQAERKSYLDEQFDDLTSALETLESAIRKIDRESRAKFKETYDKVNNDLQMLFPKVFGGGSAYLELTADDLLETGVTIMARPPGKKNSTIHLLSGGEKALTALSLVFSIFRLNPAPFCMLDEVDAPLDDANVGRFCKLVKEMSESVQFIYISHNKVAMEMATHLTGVTMQEPGVSRLVAVDIQDAVKMAEAS